MIINKSGITIRMKVSDLSIIGRATQGVRLINLEKRHDEIASVCKVLSETDEKIAEEKAERDALQEMSVHETAQVSDVDIQTEENLNDSDEENVDITE